MGFFDGVSDFLFGSPAEYEQVSNLTPSQMRNQRQLERAGRRRGAGGAFGTSADYYRDLLSNDSADFNAFAAPELRQFREQIIPDLAEQFAGMGSGALSSSGFRNAAVGAGADLSERLGALRAQLRQAGAAGLTNIGQMGLTPHSQYQMTNPGSEGFLSKAAPLIGTVGGAMIGGPAGAAVGGAFGNMFSNKGSTSPYGNQLPNFNAGIR
jgi:hypothetical protein